MEDCNVTTAYGSRTEYEQHLAKHEFMRVMMCAHCSHVEKDIHQLYRHLHSAHQSETEKKTPEGKLRDFRWKRIRRNLNIQPCPFCAEIPGMKDFVQHVIRHCEEIALSSLSQGIGEDSEDGEASLRSSLVLPSVPPAAPDNDLRCQGLTHSAKDPHEMQDDRTKSPSAWLSPNDWHRSGVVIPPPELGETPLEKPPVTASTQQALTPGDDGSGTTRHFWYCSSCGDGPHSATIIPSCSNCGHIACNVCDLVDIDSSKAKASLGDNSFGSFNGFNNSTAFSSTASELNSSANADTPKTVADFAKLSIPFSSTTTAPSSTNVNANRFICD
jgi:hypothetical protein